MSEKLRHGGDIAAAAQAFGEPAEGWLDLSTGINPVPYPVPDLPTDIWQRLPTRSDEARLINAARTYYRIPDAAALAIAPGTQALIQWLPRTRSQCLVQVIGPTYEEHAARWHAGGHDVEVIDDIKHADADVVVIVNPNNPDGRAVAPDMLLELAARQAARDGLLIVDEAFADVMPEISVTPETGQPGLLVLRSFGKFFGLAGLRLGFAVGTAADIDILSDALGRWPVAGPALAIGASALADVDWHTRTSARLADDAARLDQMLTAAGLDIIGGTSLYRLARGDEVAALYTRLGQAGILVRIFDQHPDWIRFGLPGTEAGWARLEHALVNPFT